MKFAIVVVLLSYFVQLGLLQQCRQVCEYEVPASGGDQKGDIGAPGKAGPQGVKGQKGDIGIGDKGKQGDSCALGSFESEIRERLSALENLLMPASCLTSSVYGRQTLRSGEEVFCDGGWQVFQRRLRGGSLNFNVGWAQYKRGFGELDGEFWLGLDRIYNLTTNRGCKLRVDVWKSDGEPDFAIYESFAIEDESDKYRLHVGGFSGTAGNGLTGSHTHNKMRFSTFDSDNDNHRANCAQTHQGGWWYNSCQDSKLNSPTGSLSWNDNIKVKTLMKLKCD